MLNMGTRTKRIVNGLLQQLSAFCRTKPILARWYRENRVRRTIKSNRWSSGHPLNGFAFPDAHEPLIPKQDFELVQRIRRLDTRTSPKKDTVYLFSGILICGCCGARMTRKTNRVKGKEYHYYYCPTGKKAWLYQSCDAQGE